MDLLEIEGNLKGKKRNCLNCVNSCLVNTEANAEYRDIFMRDFHVTKDLIGVTATFKISCTLNKPNVGMLICDEHKRAKR